MSALIDKNKYYGDTIFVDYFPYSQPKGERRKDDVNRYTRLLNEGKGKEGKRFLPDLVFSDGSQNISVVEFNVIVNRGRKGNFQLRNEDYRRVEEENKRKWRYILMLYSKELAVYEFKRRYRQGPELDKLADELMERSLSILCSAERNF
ncbi:MAG: hypothetical protein AMDU3_IPLC00004G0454 [Thermoplasmatales archaeon I-plasma]|jgi:hypothetical protein|nr:MAG: hypothetical protein AMDU3_IPLC00004G0454 [Thermoplasmatales archaeon I-plasma]